MSDICGLQLRRGSVFSKTKQLMFIIKRYWTLMPKQHCLLLLKVPKRDNFLLAFFAETKPIWVCDLEKKINK